MWSPWLRRSTTDGAKDFGRGLPESRHVYGGARRDLVGNEVVVALFDLQARGLHGSGNGDDLLSS